jgi:integrase/recombinase XerD
MWRKWRNDFQRRSKVPKKLANSLATLLAILLHAAKSSPTGTIGLHTAVGGRKYLTASERSRFLTAFTGAPIEVRLFCQVLAQSGVRISEALALTVGSIDLISGTVTIETLKRRRHGVFRQIPLSRPLLVDLDRTFRIHKSQRDQQLAGRRIWPWSRTTAWRYVKTYMRSAGLFGIAATPKGLRHSFGVLAFQSNVPPHIVQRWLGHASLRTTAIYGDVTGREERMFAARMWRR